MSDERSARAPDGMEGLGLGAVAWVSELAAAVPRLAQRTAAQAEFSRRVLAHLPCIGTWFRPSAPVDVPAHEARQPIDVLRVVAEPDAGGQEDVDADAEPAAEHAVEQVPDGQVAAGSGAEVDGTPAAAPEPAAPPVGELAIPEYDSLAASQVVPRLATLAPDELGAIGAYERSHRRRQTILNRVAQLLAD